MQCGGHQADKRPTKQSHVKSPNVSHFETQLLHLLNSLVVFLPLTDSVNVLSKVNFIISDGHGELKVYLYLSMTTFNDIMENRALKGLEIPTENMIPMILF